MNIQMVAFFDIPSVELFPGEKGVDETLYLLSVEILSTETNATIMGAREGGKRRRSLSHPWKNFLIAILKAISYFFLLLGGPFSPYGDLFANFSSYGGGGFFLHVGDLWFLEGPFV